MKDSGLTIAIEAIGSSAALARALGVSTAAIAQWRKVPAERVVEVEEATDVPRHVLRPDLHLRPERKRRARR